MKLDVFLSICQTEVDGFMPDEKTMWNNFFDQVQLADRLGMETAWVAETHLSCEIQKQSEFPVIPHFKGEIGLNTDILQLAHKVFSMTKNIHVGSAIRNILCNGGPLAHAEAVKTFLSLHGWNPEEKRKLHLGFASGRFEFSNRPYGIQPRNSWEKSAWPVLKGQILFQATEIFLRALRGDQFSIQDIQPIRLQERLFRTEDDWIQFVNQYKEHTGSSDDVKEVIVKPFWNFEKVGVIPNEPPMHLLELILGSHDPWLQKRANEFLPVKVFNLSITPPKVINETHERMKESFHTDGGAWQRDYMPRTAMVFLDADPSRTAQEQSDHALATAKNAWENYWRAMEGTLDPDKVQKAVDNTLAGNPEEVVKKINEKYDKDDRLMLWFDFNNHDNGAVKASMEAFMNKVAPQLNS